MQVAVKIISKSKTPDGYFKKFFPREVQAMRLIKHPNVIELCECIETPQKAYLIMEYASGGDLLEYINSRGPLTDDESRRLFRQMADAVSYCHKKQVVHRDLKCENILLDAKRNIKISGGCQGQRPYGAAPQTMSVPASF